MTLRWPDFAKRLRWLDGTPLASHIEPYRTAIFAQALDTLDAEGRPAFNLVLTGRAKKNAKTLDLVLAALFALVTESPAGHDSECYILANDGDQARDDLGLAKKLVKVNPTLQDWLTVKRDVIERKDGRGFLEILPAGDVVGQHGKSYRFVGYDEIHGYRSWDIFEAMQPDPHRLDALQWITSYASLYHRPGVPLFDLVAAGRAGTDPRMLFSWYAADYTTDPACAELPPEARANPSMGSWASAGYLAQQQRRLPAHKYRRLHLNLPGLPEGSAFTAESVMDAIERGVRDRPPADGIQHVGFVDMSGGSRDDAVLGIAHKDRDDRAVVDRVVDQGPPPPFDPRLAVGRFVGVLKDYGVSAVVGDAYAGETFRKDFERFGIAYRVSDKTKSAIYEAAEPLLNGHRVVLLDVPKLEQQLLGLVWRGGKIDHPSGEHDDYANAAAGAVYVAVSSPQRRPQAGVLWDEHKPNWGLPQPSAARPSVAAAASSADEDEAIEIPLERFRWKSVGVSEQAIDGRWTPWHPRGTAHARQIIDGAIPYEVAVADERAERARIATEEMFYSLTHRPFCLTVQPWRTR